MASQGKKKSEGESELRKRFNQNPFVFVGTFFILIIVVIAFVFVTPAGTIFGGMMDGDLTFGYYDRVPISFVPGNFFAQEYDRMSREMQAMGQQPSPFLEYHIWRQSFEAAAVHTAILRTMQRAGYEPPARVVDREVARLPIFQENGRFSPALYRQLDESSRLTLWRQTQDSITRDRFLSDVFGILTPSAEGEFMGRMASTERSFEVAVFSWGAFPDEEHEAYVRNNPASFRLAHLSMITIRESESEARRVRDAVAAGGMAFADAAMAYSDDRFATRGGDMGEMMAFELAQHDIPDAATREAVLALAEGELSDVVRLGTAWAFFRAEADTALVPDLSDAILMGRVRAYMHSFNPRLLEEWAIEQAGAFYARARDYGLEEAFAQTAGAQRRGFGPVPINFGNVGFFSALATHDLPELGGAANNEEFWMAAFSTQLGVPSHPIVQGANILVLIPVEETEASEAFVEMVADTYTHSWLFNMTPQLLHNHFLNSPRLDDRFDDTFFRVLF